MTWVLIVMMNVYGGGVLTTQTFATEAACKAALAWVVESGRTTALVGAGAVHKATCLPLGERHPP